MCLKVKKLFSFLFLFSMLRGWYLAETRFVLVVAKDELMLVFYADDYLISLLVPVFAAKRRREVDQLISLFVGLTEQT